MLPWTPALTLRCVPDVPRHRFLAQAATLPGMQRGAAFQLPPPMHAPRCAAVTPPPSHAGLPLSRPTCLVMSLRPHSARAQTVCAAKRGGGAVIDQPAVATGGLVEDKELHMEASDSYIQVSALKHTTRPTQSGMIQTLKAEPSMTAFTALRTQAPATS